MRIHKGWYLRHFNLIFIYLFIYCCCCFLQLLFQNEMQMLLGLYILKMLQSVVHVSKYYWKEYDHKKGSFQTRLLSQVKLTSLPNKHIWLCWGVTTPQPLWVILCCLPEKGRKEIEEIVEMKERDREERGTGMEETEQINTFPLYSCLLKGQQALPNWKPISVGRPGDVRDPTPLPPPTAPK